MIFSEIYNNSIVKEDDFIKTIKELLVTCHKNFSRATRTINSNIEMLNEINKRIDNKGNSTSEKLFILLYPDKVPPQCQYDQIAKFNTFAKGYWNYCKGKCKCSKLHQSNVMKEHKPHLKSIGKYKEKTGYDNPMNNPEVKEKLKQTNLKKYGSISPLGNNEVKKKAKQTNLKKYGVEYPFQNKEILQKSIDKNRKNNGDCFKVARETYSKLIGMDSIFQSKEWQKENREKLFEKYGTFCPNSIPSVKNQTMENELKNNNCKHYTQRHWSDETKNIMLDETIDWVKYVKEHGGIQSLANKLDVTEGVVARKIKEYDPTYKFSKSSIEDAIEHILITNNVTYIKNNRTLIKPYELDFYIPDFNFAIEYNSFKYHTDDNPHIDRNYHKIKTDLCKDNGIQLLQIFQDEWFLKQDIITNKILNLCGKSQKGIAARKCDILKISWDVAKPFIDKYHIQGSGSGSTVSYGCYYNMELIGVMTFIFQHNEWVLNRFSSNGKSNPGMAGKLMKQFIRDYDPDKLVSFADLRYSYGDLYNKLGFVIDKMLKPDYSYVKGNKLYNKRQFRKDKFKKYFGLDIEGKTETMLAEELGLKRIWDCGKIRYIWYKKTA